LDLDGVVVGLGWDKGWDWVGVLGFGTLKYPKTHSLDKTN